MATITPKCPHCGSRDFRSNDHVMCSTDIDEWEVDENGALIPEYSDCEAETYWDTVDPVDPEKPYECAECMKPFSSAEIVAAHSDEAEED